jgi:FMN phosphatase YigB (HAD superfamily)
VPQVKPSLILFDFDDTLAITERHMASAFYPRMQELLKPYGITMSLEDLAVKNTELYRLHGSSMHGWMHELNEGMPFTLRMFADMAPTIRAAVLPHLAPNPELIHRLQNLKAQGHTLAILTLGHRDYCLPLIRALGLSQVFPDHMVFDISVMEGRLKRHEDTFHHLLTHHLTGKYAHKVMFEDSIANLLAASKAGFTTILVKERPLLPDEISPSINHHAPTILAALDHLPNIL